MKESEEIKTAIEKLAKENNFKLTNNVDKIINAKLRFFGYDNWRKCPCVRDGEHSCISPKCKEQIKTTGKCHCNLFEK